VVSPTQRPVPENTQQSQEIGVHAPGWIRTRNSSKQAKTHALDRAASGIGPFILNKYIKEVCQWVNLLFGHLFDKGR